MKKLILSLAVLLLFFSVYGEFTHADDHGHDYKGYEHKYDDEHGEHDEYDEHEYGYDAYEEDDDYGQPAAPVNQPDVQADTFIWNRTSDPLAALPDAFRPVNLQLTAAGEQKSLSLLYNEKVSLMPLSASAQQLGAEVLWHPDQQVIEIKENDKQLLLRIGESVCYENGRKLPMPVPPMLIKGIVYVPAGTLLDGLNWFVTPTGDPAQWNLERRKDI
jgi:hypothetical protein